MKADGAPVRHFWSLFAAVLCVVGSLKAINLEYSEVLNSRGSEETATLVWGYDRQSQEIVLEVQVLNAKWIGLGLSPDGSLNGSDFVIGGWDEAGQVFLYDAHVDGEWPPVKDNSQDYQLMELESNDTHSILKVWRKWFTCDPFDQDIENDTLRVMVIYGEDQDRTYTDDHFFYKSTYFMIVNSVFEKPSQFLYHDFKLTNFLIPEQDTTYACTFLPLPQLSTKHHVIRYEPALDPNSIGIVHHILIYACPNSTEIVTEVGDCYGSDSRFSQCMTSVFGWAVGGEAFDYPGEMGVPIGRENDPHYFRIEVHYSNFEGKQGIRDNSGIRILYTPELRKYDGAILMVGIFTFPVQFIPPGVKNFKNYGMCDTSMIPEVLDEPVSELNTTTFLLHAHLTARGLRVLHYRNGTLIGNLGEDNKYDFSFQQIRNFPQPITIQIGDKIVVECTANTMDREGVTYGGPSTLNEMCIAFLFYYPIRQISACWSLIDIGYIAEVLGQGHSDNLMDGILAIESIEWDDEMREAAQKAVIEANHTVIVQNVKGERFNKTVSALPIVPPTTHSCEKKPT